MKKVKFNVTQKDIDSRSSSNICATCPVARSVRRNKSFKDALVSYTSIGWAWHLNKPSFLLPIKVVKFIQEFGYSKSNRSQAKPFSFTIEVPDGF